LATTSLESDACAFDAAQNVAALEREINRIQQELNESEKKGIENIAKITKQHEEKVKEYETIVKKLTQDNQNVVKLLEKFENQNKTLPVMKDEINNLRKSLSEEVEQRRQSTTIIDEYEQKIENMKREFEDKYKKMAEDKLTNENIMQHYEEQLNELPAMVQELESYRVMVANHARELDRIPKLENEIAELRREIELYQVQQSEAADIEKELKSLKQTFKTQNEQISEIPILKEELLRLQQEVNNYQKESELRKSLPESSEEITKLKKDIINMKEGFEKQIAEINAEHEKELNDVLSKGDNKDLLDTIKELNQKNNELIEKEKVLQKEHEEKVYEISKSFENEIKSLKEKLKEMGNNTQLTGDKSMKDVIDKLKEDHTQKLNEMKNKHEKEIQTMKMKQKELENEAEEMRKTNVKISTPEKGTGQETNESNEKLIKEIKKSYEEEKQKALEDLTEKFNAELKKMGEKVAQYEAANPDLINSGSNSNTDVEELATEVHNLKEQKEEIEQKCEQQILEMTKRHKEELDELRAKSNISMEPDIVTDELTQEIESLREKLNEMTKLREEKEERDKDTAALISDLRNNLEMEKNRADKEVKNRIEEVQRLQEGIDRGTALSSLGAETKEELQSKFKVELETREREVRAEMEKKLRTMMDDMNKYKKQEEKLNSELSAERTNNDDLKRRLGGKLVLYLTNGRI